MEKYQFAALALEMFGFSLAIMNTFFDNVSKLVDRFFRRSFEKLGTNDFFFTLAAVDYDDTISPVEKDNIAFRRLFFLLVFFPSWILALNIDMGNSFFLVTLKVLLSIPIALTIYLAIRVILIMFLLNRIVHLLDTLGSKNFVAGLGFLIGVIGVGINTFYVMKTEYFWGALGLWGVIALSIILYSAAANSK